MPFSDVLRRSSCDPVRVSALIALIVRGAASAQGYAKNIVVHFPQLDGTYYAQWAMEIARGDLAGREGIVGGDPYFLNPLYAYVLAPFWAVFQGDFIPWVLAAQALLGAATTALSAASARRLFGGAAAWVTGIAVALSTSLVHLDGHISISGMGAFLMAGAVWSCVPPREGARSGRFGGAHGPIAAGLWLGFGALARPITPLALPFFLWLQARRAAPGRRLRTATVVVLVFMAPAVLSFVRNWRVGGEPVVYTAASGANLWLGNCPAARRHGMMSAEGRFRFNPMEMHADARRYMAPRIGEDATWAEISDAFRDDTISEFVARPGDAIGYLFTKARWFFTPREVPSSASLELDREFAPLLWLAVVPTWLIAVVGCVGLALHVRRRDVLFGPGAIAAAHVAVLTIVFPLSHYRSPAVPAMAVLAGGAVAWGISAWRARHTRALAAALVGVGGLSVAAWLPPQPSTIRHAGLMTIAVCHRTLRNYDLAEEFALRALDSFEAEFGGEDLPGPWFVLGYVYFERDEDFDKSADAYLRGLEIEPADWNAWLTVVECRMLRGRTAEALALLEALVRRYPDQYYNPAVRARFAEVLTRTSGRGLDAREHVRFAFRYGKSPRDWPRAWAVPPDMRHLRPREPK